MQVAYAPMLHWMLGYGQEKAKALSYRITAFATFAILIGAMFQTPRVGEMFALGVPLFVGTMLGALFSGRLVSKETKATQKRLFQSIAMLLMVTFMVHITRQSLLAPGYAALGAPLFAHFLVGLLVGILSQLTGIGSSLLMVPGLYYFAGSIPHEAILTTLFSVSLASFPISWGYAKRGFYDATYARPALLGGLLGGGLGGWLVVAFGKLHPTALLCIFAVVSMFLCAREIAVSDTSTPKPEPPRIDL
jgi:uncharacterized membrane protein YfcA